MKNVKKALIGTALAGTLVFGAGYGTYSWFTDDVSAEGEITNHTLDLNIDKTTLFDNEKFAPGLSKTETVVFTNNGSMDQKLHAGLNLTLKKDGTAINLSKAPYKYSAKVTRIDGSGAPVGNVINLGPVNGDRLDTIFAGDNWYPDNVTTHPYPTLAAGHSIKVEIKVELDGATAGNDYQGLTMLNEFEVEAEQIEPNNAEF